MNEDMFYSIVGLSAIGFVMLFLFTLNRYFKQLRENEELERQINDSNYQLEEWKETTKHWIEKFCEVDEKYNKLLNQKTSH